MSARRTSELTPRSSAAWARLCAAALPNAARKLLEEARARGGHQVDPADAWLAAVEQKTESQARSKARREHVQGWGTGATQGEDDAAEAGQIDPITQPPGLGEWALHQDPADARAEMEMRVAIEVCDVAAALNAIGLDLEQQDPAMVNRLRGEMQSWAALDDLDEADSGDIAARDRVTRRMAQLALKAQREALERGQGVLL